MNSTILKLPLILLPLFASSASLAEEAMSFTDRYADSFSAILKQQTAYTTHSSAHSTSHSSHSKKNQGQQNEWQLDLEYSEAIDAGIFSGDIMAIARGRFDSQDELEDESANTLRVREMYWQNYGENSFWRIGKQQVVWGEADGLKLLDVINPQDFREFILDDFDDSRIPLWMLNAQINTSDSGILQLLLIPDTSTHALAESNSTYQFTSPMLVPDITAESLSALGISELVNHKEKKAKSGDIGLRYSDFISLQDSSWDITLNYLHHYIDSPVVSSTINNDQLIIDFQYETSHLIGGSASTVLGDISLRTEIAYETDRYQRSENTLKGINVVIPSIVKGDLLSSVIGLDFQGLSDHFISMQWYRQTLLLNEDKLQQAIADRDEDRLTLLWETKFLNETLTTRWQHIHGVNHGDGVLRPKVTYNWQSNIDIYLGADYFYGKTEDFFGQFNKTDRIVAGFSIGL
jgi:Protein of unknown function (DUF1302)